MKTAMIQTRVDANLKKQAEEVLSSIGMDMTSAIRLFLTQIVNHQGIPFDLRTKKAHAVNMVAEPAITYGADCAIITDDSLVKYGREKKNNWSKLIGVVQLTDEDIRNDERLAYILKK